MTETPELLPCPFCGSRPVTERTGFSGRAMYVYCVNDNDGCPRPKAIGESEEKAIENWNTCVPSPPAGERELTPLEDRLVRQALIDSADPIQATPSASATVCDHPSVESGERAETRHITDEDREKMAAPVTTANKKRSKQRTSIG